MDNITVWYIAIFLIDMALAIAALLALRFGMALLIGVHVKDELDKKDNAAFGLVIAGGTLSLLIIMAGAMSGDSQTSLLTEALSVLAYGVLGLVLLKVGILIQDNIVLKDLSIKDELKQANLGLGIVVAANLISVGIIIRAAITWVEEDSWSVLLPLLIVFVISQAALALVSIIRAKVYSSRHEGASWQQALASGNTALAIRYAGQLLGTALSLSAIAGLVTYSSSYFLETAVLWAGYSIAALVFIWVAYRLIVPILLMGIDIVEEVDEQNNTGVAAIEAAIFIGTASLLIAFVG
ncbi:MAG: hypothetical protein COC19_03965 [SAR86 cluster bacterium]|uniref:DUF350 domain-containing protein n=1 Tax=SAR86 cluster bacterium TaxID=2030880 RepID=A0A2A4MQ34_9GAMM|nr:MAG: hypothetical protein COC19_03965 [SAR86 cluster bacterium]